MKKTALVLIAIAAGAGCTSVKPVDVNKGVRDYYNQPRVYNAIEILGTNMTISMSGVSAIRMQAPLNPLNVMPREPGILDGLWEVGKWAAAGYTGSLIIHDLAARPQVISQQVVKPEIVEVPTPME